MEKAKEGKQSDLDILMFQAEGEDYNDAIMKMDNLDFADKNNNTAADSPPTASKVQSARRGRGGRGGSRTHRETR